MKIIDLLNKIANGEIDYETKIKIDNDIISVGNLIASYIFDKKRLNDEVEIIEEEKKIPEKIEQRLLTNGGLPELKLFVNQQSAELTYVINSIIDYLKSKGE